MSQFSECASLDDSFGPHAGDCRGGFDFTLLFEETILTLLPLGLMLLVVPLRIWFLWVRAKKVTAAARPLAVFKISTWIALGALQLATVILWSTLPSTYRTSASLAAAILSLVTTVGLGLLSYTEHVRTVRPSSLLSVFLFTTLLFEIARARTLWLLSELDSNQNQFIAYVFTASVAIKAIILVAEAAEKRHFLKPKYRAFPPESTSSLYSRYFFWWLNPLFFLGFKRVLYVDQDLYTLDKHLEADYCHGRVHAAWTSAAKKSPHALLKAAFGAVKWPLLQGFLPRACLTALMFCQPFLINHAITLSQETITDESTQRGYGLVGAYLLVYIGIAATMGQYQHRTYRAITMLRGGLISIIYRKTATLSLKDIDPAASMTLMSADMERIVQGWQTLHEIWANAAEVAIAIYLLERQLGVACVVPVVVSIMSLLGSIFAMNFIMSRQAMWLEAIEKRISATSAMLSSMKGVKMCGLKDILLHNIQKLRVDELRISKKFRKLIIWNMLFAYATQVLAPVLTFAIFSVRARDSGDETLDTARVFTSLSLFALLSEPLASLVMALAAFVGAAGSLTRIQKFLQSGEREDERITKTSSSLEISEKVGDKDAITVTNASFGWDSSKAPLLQDITMSVPKGKFTLVVGPVGCGKSTLLHVLLGEIPSSSGTVRLGSTSIAYCAQNPWHMNGTIRDAILGVSKFDGKWYDRVVTACALRRDFRQLPLGDQSRIGSGGIALSGGQSQRIALARAVYARREIVILDDALSGLDMNTENHVFHSLLGEKGILREMKSTVLLVSSSAKRLPYSDHIVCIDPTGKIGAQGSFADLNDTGGYVSSFSLSRADWNHDFSLENDDDKHAKKEYHDSSPSISGSSRRSSSPDDENDAAIAASASQAKANEMSRATGDAKIYLYYVRSVGWKAALLFVVAITGFVFCLSFPNIWVQWWAAANEDEPNNRLGYWLGIYGMLGGLAIVCLFVSCWQMIITMVPRTGERFHLALLKTVLSAPMSFFVNTDSGETLNRFSQDLQLIDMELPIAALNTFTTFILCIAQMALIGVGSIYAAISFPIVLLALFLVQKFYLRTSRQLRLMDIETKAPLYSLFEESLSGLSTIRAFGWQKDLEVRNHKLLDHSQRPFYLLFAAQRWLTLVLDLIVAAIALMLMLLVVQLRGTVSAGGVGLALLNVIQFSQTVKLLVTFWTLLETQIGSVSRIRSFTETAAPEDKPGEDNAPPSNWPEKGGIEFDNISAAYRDNDLVLNGVSLTIKPGEKVAVCGRTGSGKTSLIMSLFRMIELQSQQGGTIRVDGVDISTLPRQAVRQRIVGVPQHPFLLKGSVRLNADPLGVATDAAILSALSCVQVLDSIQKDGGGLDTDIDEVNLSVGQKQLFCLARAILRPGNILVLDEATSSIDAKTEEVMQRLIRKKFCNHTILAVAHRLETIMDFDKVVVLESGRLIEVGNPYELLEVPGSAFERLYSASQAEEMVVEADVLGVKSLS